MKNIQIVSKQLDGFYKVNIPYNHQLSQKIKLSPFQKPPFSRSRSYFQLLTTMSF